MNSQYFKEQLDDEDLSEYYSFINRLQKKSTQIKEISMDLFVLLDISGSMNQTSNKIMNIGAGFLATTTQILSGGLVSVDKANYTEMFFKTRLDEAKKHLVQQIKKLISQNRINKLGLITFNGTAKIAVSLTSDFQKVLNGIENQRASGVTALYDSIYYALGQLKNSSNPRLIVMTDGQDNSSKEKIEWAQKWFSKNGLKSTLFAICDGDNYQNRKLAQILHAKYLPAPQRWFSNSFDGSLIREGFQNIK